MNRTQLYRPVSVTCPMGQDALLLRRFRGREELGRPFEFQLDLLSEKPGVRFDDILGKPMGVTLQLPDGGERYFHGLVSHFSQVRGPTRSRRLAAYSATLVPWVWLLGRTQDCRIFQNKTVPEVLGEVFTSHGMSDVRSRLGDSYRAHEYCVQYRETDLNFVTRLMEREGIYYYFEHEEGRHTLVLCDDLTTPSTDADYRAIRYLPRDAARAGHGTRRAIAEETISEWTVGWQVRSGTHSLTDFDFTNPRKQLQTSSVMERPYTHSNLEMFDYPGHYDSPTDGEARARVRNEACDVRHEVFGGETDARGVRAGRRFKLEGHPQADRNREYLITSAAFDIRSDEYDSVLATAEGGPSAAGEGFGEGLGEGPDDDRAYHCSFEAIDARKPFRLAPDTPRPFVRGVQTAIVTGPSGEEIHTDEHGRVKVQFHWDRYGRRDQDSSCWIRASQPWAGTGWGGLQIPRVGQEVVVDFLEGDPDRPIITGRVYNGNARPPQSLPAAKAVSSMRSQSYPGGGGFNEISMDDTAGSEKLYLKAQFDHAHDVGHDRTTVVGNDSVETVANNLGLQVGANSSEKVGVAKSVSVGTNASEVVGVMKTVNVGTNLVLTAGTSITLQCGAASIHMNQAGFITITGTVVTMAGSVNANVAAPITNVAGAVLMTTSGAINLVEGVLTRVDGAALAHLGGAKTEVVAKGENIVSGGVVKING